MTAHLYSVRVYYEDTDMAGIVYHANYLRYIERARSDWVRQLGNDQNAMREAGIVWVVRKIEAEYLATAKFEDELIVETRLRELSGVRLTMDQVVKRGDQPIFTASVLAVCMNAAGKPVRLPAEIRALLQADLE
ncbi:tol-pal system-associated acyl-CoA thioesterase [Pseudodonghicola xiamenensis]|uniref:Tol-pal system-associated acyl-CoA thioesterase n=1 Tax=Pseudodonghicola xiamenensis TaxID=337702 RepID=A0A8J3H642_9RHOB|nr:tol-pal system-associated acyl-CoA thioesterase [Pseudodonghicola xiamenensis]GHG84225.1 tol-pal system-associated acyl-CoA thioesterase [Pseudodonghicola xiamenensis]